jgi:hypothetical protein
LVDKENQVKDGDLRGIVLEKFYEVRNQQPSMVNPLTLPGLDAIEPDQNRLLNICDQLGEYGLIHWKSLAGLTTVGGMGKISASGVDVVEGTATAPITITLHDHSISVSQSSNVQIGDSNTQGMKVRIDKLIAAVDHSQASATEKAEAKSLLEKLASNPLVKAVLGAVLGGHSN